MSKKKVTKVFFLLDETGSMDVVRQATISGFNEYVSTLQKDNKSTYMLTLVQFNASRIHSVFEGQKISDVPILTETDYVPNDLTPLYDSIGHIVKKAEAVTKKGDTTLVVIMTDGLENASKEYDRQKVFGLIKEKEEQGWAFAYLGANQDAWLTGQSIGVPMGSSLNYGASDPLGATRAAAGATMSYSGGRVAKDNLFEGKQTADEYLEYKS